MNELFIILGGVVVTLFVLAAAGAIASCALSSRISRTEERRGQR